MFSMTEERFIKATPEKVYQVVSETENYHLWNPWNIKGSGVAVVGEHVDIDFRFGTQEMTVKHKILEMVPNKRFVWCDTGWFTLFAYGERSRFIEPTGEGVLFRCEIRVTGILSWLAKMLYFEKISTGMKLEIDALKAYSERN